MKKINIKRNLIALLLAAGIGVGGLTLVKSSKDYQSSPDSYVIEWNIGSKDPSSSEDEEITIDLDKEEKSKNPILSFITGDWHSKKDSSDKKDDDEDMIIDDSITITLDDPKNPTPQPTQDQAEEEGLMKKDLCYATAILNMRLGPNENSFVIGELPRNVVVNRIIDTDEWSLVQYKDTIGYVSKSYISDYGNYDSYYDYTFERCSDILRTTYCVNFRSGPSVEDNKICELDTEEEVIALGKVKTKAKDSDWYLVQARGKIGYVSADYVTSLKETIVKSGLAPDIENVTIQKFGYLTKNTPIYGKDNQLLDTKPTYELVEVIEDYGETILANVDGVVGIISKSNYNEIEGSFITVDLSSQRICYYCNNDIALRGRCTTGKATSPTRVGFFEPMYKESGHDFGPNHNNVVSKILWEPFNGGQGLHDASWQREDTFGIRGYDEKYGSEGCVRLPDDVAEFIYSRTDVKDKILVKV